MQPSRRDFLKVSASAATLSAAPALAAKPLDILILGGTGFTGPNQVEYAVARGHRVTLLNRNTRRPDMFKGEVQQLVGDLNGDVSALKGKHFDVVIDNPTTLPAWVRNVAQYLKGNVGHYIFISTISVYGPAKEPGMDESMIPTLPMPASLDPYTLDYDQKYYGPLKAFAEKEVEKHYPGKNTIIRPGLIVGPLDQSDRFTYWPVRIDRGGRVLAPGAPSDHVQFIDARDIAEWTVRVAEARTLGTFHVTGPEKPLTIAETLYGIKATGTSGAQFTWVPADFLREQKVVPWSNLPVWAGGDPPLMRLSIAKALAAGLTFRPLAVTATETLAWAKTRPAEDQDRLAKGERAGISDAREAEVLAAWDEHQRVK